MDDKILLDNALERIKEKEGFSPYIYKCPAGKLTIGYGTNLEDRGISKAEAQMLVLNDLQRAITSLQNIFEGWEFFSAKRKVALIDMVYNLGVAGFCKFKNMILAIKKEDWDKAAKCAMDSLYAKQVGVRAKENAKWLKEG